MKVWYAVYKGDDLLVLGTADECAKELGTTTDYIRWMTSPVGKKRFESRKDYRKAITAIRLDDE